MAAVEAHNLTLQPGLAEASFSLPTGSCTAVLGPNGAGKSTLLAVLAGVFSPSTGHARCDGPVSYLPEGFPMDDQLRIRDAMDLVAGLPGWEASVAGPLIDGIGVSARTRLGSLSQGQRVQLGVALTLGRRVRTYLLDDPFLGLDPMACVRVERAIADRAAEATMVIASQRSGLSERLCDHLLFLSSGRLVWCAPTESWRSRYRRIRIRGHVDAVHELGELALVIRSGGTSMQVLLDDPAGVAERRLRRAGAVVDPVPLPLDELLMAVAG
jgi:ABC-type multidrug transport system ATPase subunit